MELVRASRGGFWNDHAGVTRIIAPPPFGQQQRAGSDSEFAGQSLRHGRPGKPCLAENADRPSLKEEIRKAAEAVNVDGSEFWSDVKKGAVEIGEATKSAMQKAADAVKGAVGKEGAPKMTLHHEGLGKPFRAVGYEGADAKEAIKSAATAARDAAAELGDAIQGVGEVGQDVEVGEMGDTTEEAAGAIKGTKNDAAKAIFGVSKEPVWRCFQAPK
ncbi:hypothetical protein FOA52_003247 [Chlamydomonas sp. UWO 241]|nr:hypothetical protein FOA52_003247 [Chlamydomonas sp. UWO 241]